MSINKAENLLENRLTKTLESADRELNALKTRQLNGGDNIVVVASPLQSFSFTLTPASTQTTVVSLQPTSQEMVIAEMAFTLYIDTKDAAHVWPNGGSINFLDASVVWGENSTATDDLTGLKKYFITVQNGNPSVTHTFYIDAKFYYPKVSTS